MKKIQFLTIKFLLMTSLITVVNARTMISMNGKTYFFDENGHARTGWYEENQKRYWLNLDGRAETGWKMIDGHKYWFFSDGHMETGWAMIKGKKYHFAPDGKMDTKWFEYKGSKYYLNTDGHAETGWDRIDGKMYWFNSDGRMETGFRKIAGKMYNFGRDGVMLTYWQMLSNKRYYFNHDGHMETGWARIGDIIYLFSKEGVLQKNVTVGDWRVDEEGYHYNYRPVYYNQTDKAWSYKVFGQYGSFGLTGCCPTTIAMIVSGIKKRTISPLEVGTWAYEKTIYFNRTEAGGLPGLIPLAAQKYGVHHKEILTYPDLEKALKEGKLVYSSQNSKSPLNLSHSGTHAVALYGYQNGKTNAFSSSFYSTNGSYSLKKLWHYQGHFEKESGVSFFAFW